MGNWLNNIISSDGFGLVVGALLAIFSGYATTVIQEVRHRKAVRQGLGSILHGELIFSSPSDDPISRDPDHAKRLSLRSIPQLLAPGILDPVRDEHLLMTLIQIDKVVDEFNERATLWDQAFAAGADEKKLQTLYNALQFSNWDYRDAHASMMAQLWQLGPPIPLTDEYKEPTWREKLKDKLDRWRTRKVRKAWMDYEKRRESPFDQFSE